MSNLFIEGPSGSGKTRMILDALGDECLRNAGGYLTVRLHHKNGELAGYRVIRACEASEPDEDYSEELSGIFIRCRKKQRTKDERMFIDSASGMLDPGRGYSLLLMDELGGVELMVDDFVEIVKKCIHSDIPVIGVLKNRDNAIRMADNLGIREQYLPRYEQFRHYMSEQTDCVIADIATLGADVTERIIQQWIRENDPGSVN